ncbi:predicted protein [Phaeodactylum tricornutum CCAP 1055/1]|uniref:Uncharacterized protein n=1 Tax=Phaeodactylum tricornutum (strain CCAP 1055/1) TaxID=556484 RepID=B7G8Z7_PHATC|nr:predicted protein [Phaeodactylum tricornutum CCAP 1055/1]EEC44861.1 predicted protein [Phaeodactylum tricornutum CCAP 1055/1]|eukprot:XP_002183679.1 predicted protein [Phaeodactylum tricornutum CCAP 1055/1]
MGDRDVPHWDSQYPSIGSLPGRGVASRNDPQGGNYRFLEDSRVILFVWSQNCISLLPLPCPYTAMGVEWSAQFFPQPRSRNSRLTNNATGTTSQRTGNRTRSMIPLVRGMRGKAVVGLVTMGLVWTWRSLRWADEGILSVAGNPLSHPLAGVSIPLPTSYPVQVLLHVIHTRFQQHQPRLVHLGRARLALFRTLCVPSLRAQTETNFLWILRVDPALSAPLRTALLAIVRDYASRNHSVLVVASNQSPERFHLHRENDYAVDDDIRNDTLWYGNMRIWQRYQQTARRTGTVVLETNLDADDGLAIDFVHTVQQRALRDFRTTPPPTAESVIGLRRLYRIYCVGQHVEWHFYAPWDRRLFDKIPDYVIQGALRTRINDRICITPGLTVASQTVPDSHVAATTPTATTTATGTVNTTATATTAPNTATIPTPPTSSPPLLPFDVVRWHHLIQEKFAACEQTSPSQLLDFHRETFVSMSSVCYEYLDNSLDTGNVTEILPTARHPWAIRARTPTSVGVEDLLRKRSRWKYSDYSASQALWTQLSPIFSVTAESLRQTHHALADDLIAILSDAIEGQCTPNHSCHDKSRTILNRVLQNEKKYGQLVVPDKLVWEQ